MATRPFRVLYFDGFSAAKNGLGAMDLQDVLNHGKVNDSAGGGRGDGDRGRALCEWGKQYNIDGFVREEASFEVIQCDFDVGTVVVNFINATARLTEKQDSGEGRRPPRPPAGPPGDPGRGPGVHPPSDRSNVYLEQQGWSFYRAAVSHAQTVDPRFIVEPAHMVSLYDDHYSSLRSTFTLSKRHHNLRNISNTDVERFRNELHQAVTDWNLGKRSGIDWSGNARGIVERFGPRLAELRVTLQRKAGNLTATVDETRIAVYGLVGHYISAPDTLSVWPSPPSVHERRQRLREASQRCIGVFTGHLGIFDLTPQEARLLDAISGVLKRICEFSTSLLGDTLEILDSKVSEPDLPQIETWRHELADLMNWLDWPTWRQCSRPCADDEVCFVPMWPIGGGRSADPDEEPQPECRSRATFREGPF